MPPRKPFAARHDDDTAGSFLSRHVDLKHIVTGLIVGIPLSFGSYVLQDFTRRLEEQQHTIQRDVDSLHQDLREIRARLDRGGGQ